MTNNLIGITFKGVWAGFHKMFLNELLLLLNNLLKCLHYLIVIIFVGFLSVPFAMKTESEGPSKLKTFVRQINAPFSLMNDNSNTKGCNWMDICNEYNIGTSTTEPKSCRM